MFCYRLCTKDGTDNGKKVMLPFQKRMWSGSPRTQSMECFAQCNISRMLIIYGRNEKCWKQTKCGSSPQKHPVWLETQSLAQRAFSMPLSFSGDLWGYGAIASDVLGRTVRQVARKTRICTGTDITRGHGRYVISMVGTRCWRRFLRVLHATKLLLEVMSRWASFWHGIARYCGNWVMLIRLCSLQCWQQCKLLWNVLYQSGPTQITLMPKIVSFNVSGEVWTKRW